MSDTKLMKRYAHKGDLTKGPVTGHLLRLTLPMVWGILAIISFQLVDMFYISLLGTKALTAISFTFPVTMGVHNLVLGMTIATSSVISRQIGAGNWARVRRLTTHALIIALMLGAFLAILGFAFMDGIFTAMGATPEMLALIRQYMVIWFAGSIFVNTPMVGNAAIRAGGETMAPALIMTVVAVVNVILDPILMFGLLGFPAMGIQGAALATVIASASAMAAELYVLGVRKKMLTRSRRHMRLFGDSAKRFMFIALPAGLTSSVQPLSHAFITALIAAQSTYAVAGYGIVARVEAFGFITIIALATGMAPIIGQNWGAGQFKRVNETLRKALTFAVSWSVCVAVILILFGRPIAGLFTDDTHVIDVAVLYFSIVPISTILGNLVNGWASAFNAMGKPGRSVIMIVVRLIVLTIPLAWLGSQFYGIKGIFGAIALVNVTTGVGFHLWNRHYCLNKAEEAEGSALSEKNSTLQKGL